MVISVHVSNRYSPVRDCEVIRENFLRPRKIIDGDSLTFASILVSSPMTDGGVEAAKSELPVEHEAKKLFHV